MYCNECGAKLENDALVCPNCGQQRPVGVESAEEPVSMSEEPVSMPEEPVSMPEEPVSMPEEPVSMPEEPEAAAPSRRTGGCGWAMVAGMLAGFAILVVVALALLGIYQGVQERTRLNRTAATEHYHKGLEQLALENYELARAEFELAVQLDAKNRDAATKLAEVDALLSSQATPTSPMRHQTAILLYNEARQHYNQANWEAAITKLEQVRALEPEYEAEQVTTLLVEAYYQAGRTLVDENRLEEAIRYFDRALELRPAEAAIREQKRWAALYLAGVGYWGANWQGAIDSFSVLYQLKPDYKDTGQRLYDAYIAHAGTLYDNGDWCAARDRYDSALAMTFSEALKAKREEAAQFCAVASLPTGTPPPGGTFIGRLLEVEDVGMENAMMIRGYVLDQGGKPMPSVQVGLSAWDWSAPPAWTNGEGVFAFDGLGNPVTYTVTLLDLPSVPLPVKADWSKLAWVEFRPQP